MPRKNNILALIKLYVSSMTTGLDLESIPSTLKRGPMQYKTFFLSDQVEIN